LMQKITLRPGSCAAGFHLLNTLGQAVEANVYVHLLAREARQRPAEASWQFEQGRLCAVSSSITRLVCKLLKLSFLELVTDGRQSLAFSLMRC
jgi:hypothetical protein